jgi:hypothetical protein
LYMESLAQHNGYWTVGGCESDRLQSARYRGLSGEFLLPLERLTAMGRQEVQSHEQIQMLYGQIAGVAHFLIDGEGGRHREAFIDLLTALYQGAAPRDMLTKLTGQPAALDQQYRAFLNVTDDDLAGIPSPQRLRKLFLGRTAVTDKGLAHLAGCKKLEWLDLSLTATGDAGLANFAAADGLTQLFLEGTRVTDASLPLIGRFPRLELLVLAGVPISDAGAAPLGNLRNLQMLYLTGTPLTDAALEHFRNLKKLETLDIRGTQITPAAIQRMRSSWPKLKEVVQ